ncbi:MAG: hypothetical protein H6606_10360 [Flavobacteriales bacterium]|nr:hypothetical protein [Flavobacteriales bacterium]
MDNEKNKSPLAQRFDGFAPGKLPSFDTFQAKRQHKRRFLWIFLASVPLIILMFWAGLQYFNQSVQEKTASTYHPHVDLGEVEEFEFDQNERNTTGTEVGDEEKIQIPNPVTQTPRSYTATEGTNLIQSSSPVERELYTPMENVSEGLCKALGLPFSFFIWKSDELPYIQVSPLLKQNGLLKQPRRPFVTISGGFNLADPLLDMPQNSEKYVHPDFEKIYNNTKVSALGMMSEFSIYIPVYKRIWVGAGLGITGNQLGGTYRFELDSVPIYDIDNTIAGFLVYPDGSASKKVDLGSASRSYQYVSVPISVGYFLDKPRFELHAEIGLNLSYMISASGNSLDAFNLKQVVPLKQVLNPEYVSGFGRLTLYKPISKSTSIGLGLSQTIQLNNFYLVDHLRAFNVVSQLNISTKINLHQ